MHELFLTMCYPPNNKHSCFACQVADTTTTTNDQLTAVGKCFLLCFQSACAPIQLHFPNVSFLQREGEKVCRENKIIFSPFFFRLGKENKINLYFCLLFRFGLCVFPFFHTVFLLATNNWHGFTGLPSKVEKNI